MTLATFDEKYYELQFPESILDWSSSSTNLLLSTLCINSNIISFTKGQGYFFPFRGDYLYSQSYV